MSANPTTLRTRAVTWIIACTAATSSLRAQTPSDAGIDRAAVQQIVREELAAEKAQIVTAGATEAEPASQADPEWIPIGKDRSQSVRWDNGFVAETADKSFRVHLGGRLEFDNSWFTQDDNILIGQSADQRMKDGTLFRRARFRMDGLLW
jgi:hypothetical protein